MNSHLHDFDRARRLPAMLNGIDSVQDKTRQRAAAGQVNQDGITQTKSVRLKPKGLVAFRENDWGRGSGQAAGIDESTIKQSED